MATSRKRNPRRLALEHIAQVVRLARRLKATWNEPQTVWETDPSSPSGGRWRPRREDEKVENNINAWYRLHDYAAAMETQATLLRSLASDEIRKLADAQTP